MPRRQFVADLQSAVQGVSVAGISDVHMGGDDGEFTFQCTANNDALTLSVLVPELSDYPSSHSCMIFAPDDAPASVASALADIADAATGKPIIQLLELVARRLGSTDHDGDQQMLDSQEFEGYEDSDSEEDYFPDDELLARPIAGFVAGPAPGVHYTRITPELRRRICSDLRTAKASGFKVGHLGGLMEGTGCYVVLSCRIAKLGISEEAMQAWQVEPSEYLICLLHYPNGYKSMDSLKGYDVTTAQRNFGVRVGISTTYKPTMQEAVRAFTVLSKEAEERREKEFQSQPDQAIPVRQGFRNSFISRPLNELLDQRFPQLLHYRYNGMPWQGAEKFYNDSMAAHHAHSDLGLDDRYMAAEHVSTEYPRIVTADHIQESTTQEHSLPLVAMQFVLRHFVRCTEFCLICFNKMPDDLQAIKPYVCDNPLCLYQYMSLGFGPSIEHEIMSQPKVVDLLISFCYTSARSGRLKDFPSGLSLMVPAPQAFEEPGDQSPVATYNHSRYSSAPVAPQDPSIKELPPPDKMKFNSATREILFGDITKKCPVRTGDWIIIRLDKTDVRMHCRILETSLYPTIQVSEPLTPLWTDRAAPPHRPFGAPTPPPQQPGKATPTLFANEFVSASFQRYGFNFDEMSDNEKRRVITSLLDLVPSVAAMKNYLLRKAQSSLSSWVDRMSPAALGLVRWILASNRACILQVGDEEQGGRKGEDRLYGMQGWSQFRFAMGAPDKERRFVKAVRETTDRLKLRYPTLFAWHGSPLQNWHSIIREGLHFHETHHGRAFGNGVYHSLESNTSLSYSGSLATFATQPLYWPMSELKMTSALALNEIVNAPKEFVSMSPHLVVSQLDWIQTRYLFIQTGTSMMDKDPSNRGKESKPIDFIEQDPKMTPRGNNDLLIVPVHAVSGARRPKSKNIGKSKRQKATGSSAYDPIDLDGDFDLDDGASIATLDEDLEILYDENHRQAPNEPDNNALPTPNSTKGKEKAGAGFLSKLGSKLSNSSSSKPLTNYVPGTLDYNTITMLQQPRWASTAATRRLMKDFQELVKIQNNSPPHELGWHIDEDQIENVYQWIVELHSFEPSLPLAQDMKKKGYTSVVLELRFGKDYPMSPPFVRVIRPRFLGFQQGGGGHVTAGGALCMELLTNDGWSAVSSIESVLLQVRMAMSSLDPKPARLEGGSRSDYGVGEAVEAYMRACHTHGWTVPPGFKEMAYGGASDTYAL